MATLAVVLTTAGPALAQDAAPLGAPLQLDAVMQEPVTPEGKERGPALGHPRLLVDLGSADDGRPVPAAADHAAMTILGTQGPVTATLAEIVKRCRYLCGEDEAATCHYAAALTLDRPVPELGLPIAALPGKVTLSGWRMVAGRPGEDVAAPALADTWSATLWSPDAEYAPEYRIRRVEADFVLEGRYRGGETFEVPGGECRAERHDELTALSCGGFAALLREGRPLLVSVADYGSPAADLLGRFEHGGNTHWLVRLGLKAQAVIGLLVRTPDGWRAVFRPRDHAQIC